MSLLSQTLQTKGWPLTRLLTISALSITGGLFSIGRFSEPALLNVIRFSARAAMLAFLCAFIASSLYKVWPGKLSQWLRQQRRYLGVGFAVIFTLHITTIDIRALLFPAFLETLDTPSLIGGAMCFLFIVLMAASSNNSAQRLFGKTWGIFHWLGSYYVFFIFFSGELMWMQEDRKYIPYAVLMLIVLGLRLLARTQLFTNRRATA